MSDLQSAIVQLIKTFKVSTDGHDVYILAANRENFSYIILDEDVYSAVNGETNGNFITSTHEMSEEHMIDAVKSHCQSELMTANKNDFPRATAKPFQGLVDLYFYLKNKRQHYDASSKPEYHTDFWWPNRTHKAWIQADDVSDLKKWLQSVFGAELQENQFEQVVEYRNKPCEFQWDNKIKKGFIEINLKFCGAPFECPWHSSIGLARSLFESTGKMSLCPPCMMSHEPNHLYCIGAKGEGLVGVDGQPLSF